MPASRPLVIPAELVQAPAVHIYYHDILYRWAVGRRGMDPTPEVPETGFEGVEGSRKEVRGPDGYKTKY